MQTTCCDDEDACEMASARSDVRTCFASVADGKNGRSRAMAAKNLDQMADERVTRC